MHAWPTYHINAEIDECHFKDGQGQPIHARDKSMTVTLRICMHGDPIHALQKSMIVALRKKSKIFRVKVAMRSRA